MKLLEFLKNKYEGKYSVKQLKKIIDSKGCFVGGKVVTISTRLVDPAEKIEIDPSVLTQSENEILYEDDQLVVCNKSVGVICEAKTFTPLILVHRLDKETSGVLILAKSLEAKKRMVALFKEKAVKKSYLAIVDGIPKKEVGKVDSPIENQEAVTHWKLLKKGKNASLLLCEPITGRTHQIRIHLAQIGHPILGDLVYGKKFHCRFPAQRHLLHAYSIFFEKHKIIAQLPKDFLYAIKQLGLKT